jgi:hypothetical protein
LPDAVRRQYFGDVAADDFSPAVGLDEAVALAKAHVVLTKVDTARHYLKSVALKFEGKDKGHGAYWEAQWMGKSRSHKGDWFIVRIEMDKTASVFQGK